MNKNMRAHARNGGRGTQKPLTLRSRSPCTTNPVDVIFDLVRHIVIDNVTDILHVQTAGSHVSCHLEKQIPHYTAPSTHKTSILLKRQQEISISALVKKQSGTISYCLCCM